MSDRRRILLKLSGEALAGDNVEHKGFDEASVRAVAGQVRRASEEGVQIAIVIGGGNFWRGRQGNELDRVKADQIGMLATVMNCLYVAGIFETEGMKTSVYTAFPIDGMTKVFNRDDAAADLDQGRIVFFGGAGVSTESGIPDFRSANGLYNQDLGRTVSPEEMISHTFYVKHPEQFFEFYRDKLIYEDAEPNNCHKALAELEKQGKVSAVVTQNIDGLHQKAGSKVVWELHGSVLRNYCENCHAFYDVDKIIKSEGVPKCDKCGGRVKPDVCAVGVRTTLINPLGQIVQSNGTSFATPLLAGLAACLWSALPTENAMQIRERIIRSADRYTTPDAQLYGYGIPDAWVAYTMNPAAVDYSFTEIEAPRKILRGGQILILHHGQVYNVAGQRVE